MKSTRPTSRDIARLAEVSPGDGVARAAQQPAGAARNPRAHRVDRAAAQLPDRPRAPRDCARAARTRWPCCCSRNRPKTPRSTRSSCRCSATSRARRHGVGSTCSCPFQQLSDDWHTDYQLSNRADGLDPARLRRLPHLDAAAAEAGRQRARTSCIWGPDVDGTPGRYVRTDNTAGGLQATRHLLRLGRTPHRVSRQCLGPLARVPGAFQRLRARAARRRHRARSAPAVEAQSSEPAGHEAATALLDVGRAVRRRVRRQRPDRHGRDRRCCAIAAGRCRATWPWSGFDDIAAAAHFIPPLTTVQQDTHRAADMLVDNLLKMTVGRTGRIRADRAEARGPRLLRRFSRA